MSIQTTVQIETMCSQNLFCSLRQYVNIVFIHFLENPWKLMARSCLLLQLHPQTERNTLLIADKLEKTGNSQNLNYSVMSTNNIQNRRKQSKQRNSLTTYAACTQLLPTLYPLF